MCGIAGFIGEGKKEVLHNMIHSIDYRGPDFIGMDLIDNVGLSHSRLSIIDLDPRSNQPFYSENKTVGLVFNGEIYNYLELKAELSGTGKYNFKTSSDTEVVLYAYMEYGKEMLAKLNGMFALGVYDFGKKELLLARDRMGKKPLYYYHDKDTFVFASEAKSVNQHPNVKQELNYFALNEYLTFDYVPTPNSMFENVKKLEAANYLVLKNGEITEKASYYDISFIPVSMSYSDAKERLYTLLDDAVKRRLMSDVPLGVFLSGGLDSSAITYFAQKNSEKRIKTFSIGFNENSYDESNYARLVAKKLNTEHFEEVLTAEKSIDLLMEVMNKLDEPFADPSIIPTYFLSEFTKKHVTVALGGDGSDELMAGYPTFISEKVAGIFHKSPKQFFHFADWIANFLPVNDRNISLDFKIKQFLKGFELGREETHSLWLGSFTPSLKSSLLTEDVKKRIGGKTGLEIIHSHVADVKTETQFNRILYVYFKTYLQDDILVKVDRASMYNSLEVRSPFMDVEVVDFLNSQPKSFKIKGGNVKRILKDIMKGHLPEEVVSRPKKGFGIPVSLWMRNELKDITYDLLNETRIKNQGIFDHKFVSKILQEHQSCKRNHRKLLWNLLVFQIWHKNNLN